MYNNNPIINESSNNIIYKNNVNLTSQNNINNWDNTLINKDTTNKITKKIMKILFQTGCNTKPLIELNKKRKIKKTILFINVFLIDIMKSKE